MGLRPKFLMKEDAQGDSFSFLRILFHVLLSTKKCGLWIKCGKIEGKCNDILQITMHVRLVLHKIELFREITCKMVINHVQCNHRLFVLQKAEAK